LGVADGESGGRTARLYYGVQSPEDLCFVDKFPEWESMGFQVVPVLSKPPEDGWNGRTGYVQNCLEEDGVPIPRNSGALMCGMKGMAESVKDLLTKAGVFEGRILTNF
jgi:NAD(P)H-flavin reductase